MSVLYTPAGETGLILSEASREWLKATAMPVPELRLMGNLPERVNPDPWMPMEDQANQGSCAGHSLTSNVELAIFSATGFHIQLSRQHGYIGAQREDGIRGDSGSTISGGVKLAKKGICREVVWPYPRGYQANPPAGWDAVNEDAANYQITQTHLIEDADQLIRFLGSLWGGLHAGFMWSGSIDEQANRTGVVERFVPGRGGHAVGFLGYELHKFNGREILMPRMWNSWSRRWGFKKDGTCLWTPEAFNDMLRHSWTEQVGLSHPKLGPGAKIPGYDTLFQTSA